MKIIPNQYQAISLELKNQIEARDKNNANLYKTQLNTPIDQNASINSAETSSKIDSSRIGYLKAIGNFNSA